MSYPSTWKKIKFGDIAKRKSIRIDNPKESEYERYVGLEHLDSGELVVKRWGSTKDVSSNMQIFKKNNILFARRNTYLKRISVSLFDGVCSGDIIVIEPILNHIVEGFLPIYMQFEEFENKVVAWSAGAFSKRIKWKQLSDFEIWIPSKEEQQKIVDVIWSIHNNQERIEKIIQLTEKLKRGLLEQLLTKGIGHKKFKKTELGEIPEEWNVGTLSDYCEIIMGQSPPSSSYNSKKDGLPFIQGKTEFGKINPIISTFTSAPAKIAEIGDLLFTVRAPVGAMNWCNDKTCIGRGIAAFRPKNNTNPHFLYFILEKMNYELNRLSQGSTFTAITGKELKEFSIPKVPTNEQNIIGNLLSLCDQQIDNFSKHFSKLTQLKKKLTNEFLSGNLLIPKEVLN